VLRVRQNRDPLHLRHDRLDHFQALADQVKGPQRHAGGVATGPCQALHQTGLHGITAERKHERHPARDGTVHERRGDGLHHDHRDRNLQQFLDDSQRTLRVTQDESGVDTQFPRTDIPQLAQAVPKFLQADAWVGVRDPADPR
jgi:hypothetical protein